MSPDSGAQGTRGAGIARRDLLVKALAWGGAGAIAATPAVAAAAPKGRGHHRGRKVVYDVACLGDTLRIVFAPGARAGDRRGSTFSVEGVLYKAGTIPGAGFDPAGASGMGHWFCRGWFVLHPGRPDPHVISTQEYLIGTIRPDRLFPSHQLASSGTEGAGDEKQTPVRSVIGGTGMFDGARGTVLQLPRHQHHRPRRHRRAGPELPLHLLAPPTPGPRPRADRDAVGWERAGSVRTSTTAARPAARADGARPAAAPVSGAAEVSGFGGPSMTWS